MPRRRVSMAEEWQSWAKRYDIDGGVRTFESGLTVKVVLGALFVGLLMMPGSIYLTLVSGQSGAGAAPWVAVILFTELARRSKAGGAPKTPDKQKQPDQPRSKTNPRQVAVERLGGKNPEGS